MRILYIHTRYLQSAGGEDTTVDAELQLMGSRGHQCKLLLFDNATMGQGLKAKIGTAMKAVYNRASASRLKEAIDDFRPDIIHVHNFFFTASPSVMLQAQKQKVPVVVTLHNFRLICANALLLRNNAVCELCINQSFPWFGVKYKCYHDSAVQSAAVGAMSAIHKWMNTWSRAVDQYITPSEFIRKKLIGSSFNVPANQITVKRNFTADPGEGDITKRESFYLFVGRISIEKGIHLLIEAWHSVEATIVVAGDGPEFEAAVRGAERLHNISFIGKQPREKVIELMKRCRALVMPSIWYEGLPFTIVEALATGTPVITSRLGGMEEMVQHQSNGLLFEPGSAQSLSSAIEKFEEEAKKENTHLYTNARMSYLQHYHPDRCYDSIMSIYSDVISNKEKP